MVNILKVQVSSSLPPIKRGLRIQVVVYDQSLSVSGGNSAFYTTSFPQNPTRPHVISGTEVRHQVGSVTS